MTDLLRCDPGQFWQADFEEIPYTVNVGALHAAPTGASVYVFLSGSGNKSASHLSGNPSISGSLVTTPCVHSLSSGEDYRVVVEVEQSGQIKACYFDVTGQDITRGVDLT